MGEKLRHELRKKHPFASPEQEAALNLLRSADRLSLALERLFRRHGLKSGSQYNVLRILRGEGKPLPVLEIAARTITVVPGITGLVDRLEKAGLVRRERCPEDRRVIYVALTDEGARLLERLEGPLTELHGTLLGHLSRAELRELIRLLEKARAPFDDE